MKHLVYGACLLLFIGLSGCKSIGISGSGYDEYPEYKEGYRDGDPDAPKFETVEEWKKRQEEEKKLEEEKLKKKEQTKSKKD
ncbi:hypothetical protein KEM09_00490 [Carboxylicivirga mesophila]|uniref:Lipoprotein n=1 Tax=Carboxylicivirga mesophila TaxID=1166478 RepID=A0ABS5K4A9_9BACT|nr:hypothetical protein [Carboxylicivirga mesophila]MBS2209861.1 hypothetical protein [Carboxylicivirga mesophila]